MTVTHYSEEELLEEERRTILERVRLEEEMYNEEETEREIREPMYASREEEGEQKKEPRISNFTAGLIIVFVSVVEITQFALTAVAIGAVISPIITFCAQVTLAFWFWMKGVSFKSTKKIVTVVISLLIEFIPVIDILPAFLAQTIIIILLTKAEDGALGKVASLVPGGEKLAGTLEKTLKKV